MSLDIKSYTDIVGNRRIDELFRISEHLEDVQLLHINSTREGGGVAEIIERMNPLLRSLNVDSAWEVMNGKSEFFEVTKKIHNTLHGITLDFSQKDKDTYLRTQEENRHLIDEAEDSTILIHDSQPAGLIKFRNQTQKHWIYRCHIDVSNPYPPVWDFLSQFINQFDDSLFHMKDFTQKLNIPQVIIPPSIDPLSEKNRDMSENEIERKLNELPEDLPQEKIIITQISRFDRLKDPVGVVKAFKIAKRFNENIHLVLAGGSAVDDPEGNQIYQEVLEEVNNDPGISVWQLPHDSLLINALQRKSDIIIQKSLKEGFGLTVSEALWKSKPVIATNVGGIKSQIFHNKTGVLVNSIGGTAIEIIRLSKNEKLRSNLGKAGKNHVRGNFLITRHIKDYLLLLLYGKTKEEIRRSGIITY